MGGALRRMHRTQHKQNSFPGFRGSLKNETQIKNIAQYNVKDHVNRFRCLSIHQLPVLGTWGGSVASSL